MAMKECSTEIPDETVLGFMVDGGEQLCEHAIQKWLGFAYGHDEEMRQEHLKRWTETKRRIRPVARAIRESWRAAK